MLKQAPKTGDHKRSLLSRAGVAQAVTAPEPSEEVWIEVIQKMDAVYAELVENQVELEAKNAALEEAQQLIGGVFASMTDVLAVCDRLGRIQRANVALERVTGRRESELIGQKLTSIFTPGCITAVEAMLARLRDDGGVADCEVALCDSSGVSAPFAMNCSARYDHKGRYAGGVMVGRPARRAAPRL